VTPDQPLSLDAVLTEMKDGTLANLSVLVRLTLLQALVSVLLSLVPDSDAFTLAISTGVAIFIGVAYTGMVIVVLCVNTEDESLAGLWKSLSPVLATLVWVSLIVGAGVAVGLILLIIPGLILLTMWVIAQPVAVVEKPGVFRSLTRSSELVRGNGPRVFLFLLLLGILLMLILLVALAPGTGVVGSAIGTLIVSVTVNPLTAIGPAALYNCLSEDPDGSPEPDDEAPSGAE
jgi:hypothetical protein